MVKIKTYYDYGIKKEAFKISGDVGYTKSTDIMLTEDSFDDSRVAYGVQTFTVNVVGNRGTSHVIIYDNGTPINITVNGTETDMIEWAQNTSEITFTTKIAYDVEHNIQAKYLPNNRCLGSKSRNIQIEYSTSEKYTTSIERTDSTVYYQDVPIACNFKFKVNSAINETQTIPIKAYVYEEEYDYTYDAIETSVNLPANTTEVTGSVNITNLISQGAKRITLIFEGNEDFSRSEISYDISYGLTVTVDEPTHALINTPLTVPVTVQDYLGNPLTDKQVSATTTISNGIRTTTYINVDSNGQAEIEIPTTTLSLIHSPQTTISINVLGASSRGDFSIPVYQIDRIEASPSDALTAPSNVASFTGTIVPYTREYAAISTPIKLSLTNADNDYVYTDSTGNFSFNYTAKGAGDTVISMTVDNITDYVSVEDLYAYYIGNTHSNLFAYSVVTGAIRELTNGLKLTSAATGNSGAEFYNTCTWRLNNNALNNLLLRNLPYTVEFDVKDVTGSPKILVGTWYNGAVHTGVTNETSVAIPNNSHIVITATPSSTTIVADNSTTLYSATEERTIAPFAMNLYSSSAFTATMNNIKIKKVVV